MPLSMPSCAARRPLPTSHSTLPGYVRSPDLAASSGRARSCSAASSLVAVARVPERLRDLVLPHAPREKAPSVAWSGQLEHAIRARSSGPSQRPLAIDASEQRHPVSRVGARRAHPAFSRPPRDLSRGGLLPPRDHHARREAPQRARASPCRKPGAVKRSTRPPGAESSIRRVCEYSASSDSMPNVRSSAVK